AELAAVLGGAPLDRDQGAQLGPEGAVELLGLAALLGDLLAQLLAQLVPEPAGLGRGERLHPHRGGVVDQGDADDLLAARHVEPDLGPLPHRNAQAPQVDPAVLGDVLGGVPGAQGAVPVGLLVRLLRPGTGERRLLRGLGGALLPALLASASEHASHLSRLPAPGVDRRGRLRHLSPKPPVEPNPPVPRTDSGSSAASTKRTRSTRCTTSCAIRSPRASLTGVSRSVLSRVTRISPR